MVQAGERDRVQAAHRAWYLALAEAADRDVYPGVAAAWPAERIELDHDDLRTAVAGAIRDDPQTALRLANAVWWWWMARGYFAEGSRLLEAALATAPEPTLERARALVANGALEVRRRRPLPVLAFGREALEIVRSHGDRRGEARAFERLGVIALGIFDWAVADRAFERGLAIAHELEDDAIVVAIKQAQGVRLGCLGETASARALLDESLELLAGIPDERGPLFWALHISPVVIPTGPGGAPRYFFEDTYCLFRAVRSSAGTGYVLLNVGEVLRAEGAHARAREPFERALERFRDLGDEQGMGVALNALGNLSRSTGEYDAGRVRFEEALALRRAARDAREIAMTLMGMGMLALQTGDRDEGERLIEEANAIYVRTDDGPGVQGVPINLGAFALDGGDPERAVALFERCIELCRIQGLDRHRGWGQAELAEAALAIGDLDRARTAVEDAHAVFEAAGDRRGMRRAQAIAERLGAPATAD
jgi:tetratricopeptide (TPR) repeat protein